jgi:hypothetical protein
MHDPPEIISLNAEHLDIEELERRLELASGAPMLPDAWLVCGCDGQNVICGCDGQNVICGCNGTLCGCNGTLCTVDGCGADLCITDGCSSNTCIDPTQPGCEPS